MIGQPILRIIPPELAREEEILARLRRGERIAHFDTERVARDGRRLAVSLTVSPIRDATGRVVGASKIARDVTARKQPGTTQRQLLEELNHRVRNTLATIQAIAGQSLRRSPSPEAFVRSFGGRVQALARVHDLLVAGEMAGVELAAILEVELGRRRRARRGRGAGGDARPADGGPGGAGAARARRERPAPRRPRAARTVGWRSAGASRPARGAAAGARLARAGRRAPAPAAAARASASR